MNVHAEQLIAPEDQLLFRQIRNKMRWLIIADMTSCHVVAQAVATCWPVLTIKHGRFMTFFEHSWLVTPHGNIIDVYPVAVIGGPLLLDGSVGPYAADVFIETKDKWAIEPSTLAAIVKALSYKCDDETQDEQTAVEE